MIASRRLQLQRDIVRLADDVRGEVGMSRAIELARAGATKEAVSDATGLSLEEAEAIVTFHGRSRVIHAQATTLHGVDRQLS